MPFTRRALALLLLLAPLTTTPDAARLSQQARRHRGRRRPAGARGLRRQRAGSAPRQAGRPHHQPQRHRPIQDSRDRSAGTPQGSSARRAVRAGTWHSRRCGSGCEDRRRHRREDRRADLFAVPVGGPRTDARDAEGRGRARLRSAGSRRPHLDLRVDNGAVDADGRVEEAAVRGPGSAESDRRRDRRGRAAGSEVQVVRRDVPDSGAPRDDGRRARHALQPALRHRRRSHGRACRQLAPFAVAGRYRVCRGSTPRRTSARWPRCRITLDRCTSRAPT